jgi:hypothetical protein
MNSKLNTEDHKNADVSTKNKCMNEHVNEYKNEEIHK